MGRCRIRGAGGYGPWELRDGPWCGRGFGAQPIHGEVGHRWGLTLALEGLAGAIAENQPRRAARLVGAAAALREAIRRPLPPVERPAFDALLADLQRHLGPDAFAEAWTSGGALTPDEVLAEAEAGSRQFNVAT